MANLKDDDVDDLDGRTGLVFGADKNLAFSPNMSFQTGLFYVNKGAKESIPRRKKA